MSMSYCNFKNAQTHHFYYWVTRNPQTNVPELVEEATRLAGEPGAGHFERTQKELRDRLIGILGHWTRQAKLGSWQGFLSPMGSLDGLSDKSLRHRLLKPI